MPLDRNYFITEFSKVLLPLKEMLTDEEIFISKMKLLGWELPEIPSEFSEIILKIEALHEAYLSFDFSTISVSKIEELYETLIEVFNLIDELSSNPTYSTSLSLSYGALENDEHFSQKFPKQIVDYLIIEYIRSNQSTLYKFLKFFGIINDELIEATANRPYYINTSIKYNKITEIFTDPIARIKETYDWGEDEFSYLRFIRSGLVLLDEIGGFRYNKPASLEFNSNFSNYYDDGTFPLDLNSFNTYYINLLWARIGNFLLEAGIGFHYLPPDGSSKPGFSLIPYVNSELNISQQAGDYFFTFKSDLDFENGIGLLFRPEEDIAILNNLHSSSISETIDGKATFQLIRKSQSDNGIILLGDEFASNLNCEGFIFEINLDKADDKIILTTYFGFPKATFRIIPKEDGLLSKLIPSEGYEIDFELLIGYSSEKGLFFKGNLGLEIKFPIKNQQFGNDQFSIALNDIYLLCSIKESGFFLGLESNLNVDLGPLSLSISKMGLTSNLTIPESGANFGIFDLKAGFKPPTGVGIAIKSSNVSGGGFLDIDAPNHKYTGALELKIQKLSINAIGILKTKLPGGKDGFSLLLLITVDGFKAVPLGFGFSLTGVGGLLGLNRTANLQALRDGVRTGANQSILFPKDIVKNADKIISDLETCFPDKEGRFLIGPMAKIIWGSPKPLITIDLGLIIEIPNPVMVAILGVVSAVLPDEKNKKLIIHINFLGTIEFDKKLISFDATIYESKILNYDISGDMAFRLKWGEQSNFLLSVGGFHPAFTPPPMNLPVIRRILINLVNEQELKVGMEAYFAITSNTVQIGAKIAAYAKHGNFSAKGIMWLDVLFQFNPFYFLADMGAMVAISKGNDAILSATLKATLQGPSPWNVRGTVEFKVLSIAYKLDFNKTFGEHDDAKLEDKEVWPELMEAIKHKDNWAVLMPERNQLFVSTKGAESATQFLHPLGKLALNQSFTPLNFNLGKFGHVKPKDYKKFNIYTVFYVKNNISTELTFTKIKDKFSPAQFIPMSDSEKLSKPSFEDFESGISIGTDNLVSSYTVAKELKYQQPKVFDRRIKAILTGPYSDTIDFCNDVMVNNTVNNTFSNPIKSNVPHDGPSQIGVKPKVYAVAKRADLTAYDTATFSSIAEAEAHVIQVQKTYPTQKNKLMVTESLELVS